MTAFSIRGNCWIGGQWVGRPEVPVINPATGEEIAKVPDVGSKGAAEAVASAASALEDWRSKTATTRSSILRRWFDLIIRHRDELARLLTTEQGKPFAEARVEIDYAASFVELYAEEAKRIYGEIIPSPRADSRIMVTRHPVGVVAAITPWNFPAAMVTRKVAPALAAGCTVVLKPAPDTPLTALALAELAHEAGLPPGVLNVVTGNAVAIGEVLTSDPLVRLLTFTGSTAVGKQLMRQCAGTVKKVGLELGGNAPFIVFDDADLNAAAVGLMDSKFRNSGQTCISANRIFVHAAVHDSFVEKLTPLVNALCVGNGLDPDVDQGPLINRGAVEKVERHIADALGQGGVLITGGKRHKLGYNFFEPTIIAEAHDKMLLAGEETFGPVAAIFRFDNEKDVCMMANKTASGLAAYIYTRDLSRIERLADSLEFGMVGVNTGSISTAVAPFGGVKESGIGREGSRHGIEEFTELKYLNVSFAPNRS